MYEYCQLDDGDILLFKDHILICVISNLLIIPKEWKELKKINGGYTNEK